MQDVNFSSAASVPHFHGLRQFAAFKIPGEDVVGRHFVCTLTESRTRTQISCLELRKLNTFFDNLKFSHSCQETVSVSAARRRRTVRFVLEIEFGAERFGVTAYFVPWRSRRREPSERKVQFPSTKPTLT